MTASALNVFYNNRETKQSLAHIDFQWQDIQMNGKFGMVLYVLKGTKSRSCSQTELGTLRSRIHQRSKHTSHVSRELSFLGTRVAGGDPILLSAFLNA